MSIPRPEPAVSPESLGNAGPDTDLIVRLAKELFGEARKAGPAGVAQAFLPGLRSSAPAGLPPTPNVASTGPGLAGAYPADRTYAEPVHPPAQTLARPSEPAAPKPRCPDSGAAGTAGSHPYGEPPEVISAHQQATASPHVAPPAFGAEDVSTPSF